MTRAQEWSPDVLGEPFEQLTLPLKPDAEGEVVATLVRYAPPPHLADLRLLRAVAADADVLYVHGWSDYFFQKELARFWHENGARFFAIDLRKSGRSLRPWQTPGFVDDLILERNSGPGPFNLITILQFENEQVLQPVRILQARHLHEDAVAALALHDRLGSAEFIDAAVDDFD